MLFNKRPHYVYIVSCADGTLYTGTTWNLRLRVARHNGLFSGGAKYTLARRPVFLVHIERFDSLSEARRREYEIKQLSRAEKETLIKRTTKEQVLAAI